MRPTALLALSLVSLKILSGPTLRTTTTTTTSTAEAFSFVTSPTNTRAVSSSLSSPSSLSNYKDTKLMSTNKIENDIICNADRNTAVERRDNDKTELHQLQNFWTTIESNDYYKDHSTLWTDSTFTLISKNKNDNIEETIINGNQPTLPEITWNVALLFVSISSGNQAEATAATTTTTLPEKAKNNNKQGKMSQQTWKALQQFAKDTFQGNATAAITVGMAISLYTTAQIKHTRSCISALTASIKTKNNQQKLISESETQLHHTLLKDFILWGINNAHAVDWHIVSNLAKMINLSSSTLESTELRNAIFHLIHQEIIFSSSSTYSSTLTPLSQENTKNHQQCYVNADFKTKVSSILTLTIQLGPWSTIRSSGPNNIGTAVSLDDIPSISPLSLIDWAMQFDLWHTAERLCESVLSKPELAIPCTTKLMQSVMDTNSPYKSANRAILYVSNYYDLGGKQYYVQAHFMHAQELFLQSMRQQSTLTNATIEKLVQRVDDAVDKVLLEETNNNNDNVQDTSKASQDANYYFFDSITNTKHPFQEAKLRVRTFILQRLDQKLQQLRIDKTDNGKTIILIMAQYQHFANQWGIPTSNNIQVNDIDNAAAAATTTTNFVSFETINDELSLQQQKASQALKAILDDIAPLIETIQTKTLETLSNFVEATNGDILHDNEDDTLHQKDLTSLTTQAANYLISVSEQGSERALNKINASRKDTRKKLERSSSEILQPPQQQFPTLSNWLSLLLVTIALSVGGATPEARRAAASALSCTISKHLKQVDATKYYQQIKAHSMLELILLQLFRHCSEINNNNETRYFIDWHIITGFARAIQVDAATCPEFTLPISKIINSILNASDDDDDNNDMNVSVDKTQIAAVLALAAQMKPWGAPSINGDNNNNNDNDNNDNNHTPWLSPDRLIEAALPFDLWYAAEQICHSLINSSKNVSPQSAVQTLINASLEYRTYRRADSYASEFYHFGGNVRYLEARYLHACETIVKVVRRRALQVIEKQVERVDKAVEKVLADGITEYSCEDGTIMQHVTIAKQEIRMFAIRQLEMTMNVDAAYRLATLWDLDYEYDPEAIEKATQKRKATYLQWEEAFPSDISPPSDVISTPQELLNIFQLHFKQHEYFGFDCEWHDEDDNGGSKTKSSQGADLLQLSSINYVALIDLPQLIQSAEGIDALKRTVGTLFADPSYTLIGFSCRQDVSMLKNSKSIVNNNDKNNNNPLSNNSRNNVWFPTITTNVIDLQKVVLQKDSQLGKFGLSRVCQHYLGKPLDKSEQCSLWDLRPLSLQQRIYASLDAWVCIAIYNKLVLGSNDDMNNNNVSNNDTSKQEIAFTHNATVVLQE